MILDSTQAQKHWTSCLLPDMSPILRTFILGVTAGSLLPRTCKIRLQWFQRRLRRQMANSSWQLGKARTQKAFNHKGHEEEQPLQPQDTTADQSREWKIASTLGQIGEPGSTIWK